MPTIHPKGLKQQGIEAKNSTLGKGTFISKVLKPYGSSKHHLRLALAILVPLVPASKPRRQHSQLPILSMIQGSSLEPPLKESKTKFKSKKRFKSVRNISLNCCLHWFWHLTSRKSYWIYYVPLPTYAFGIPIMSQAFLSLPYCLCPLFPNF